GVVDVEAVIGDVAVDGGVHPGAPARAEVAGTLLLPGFADGDGVARAVPDLAQRRRPVGPEGAGRTAGRVARGVVGGEVTVEQVVAARLAGAGIGPVSIDGTAIETVTVERGRVLVRRAGVDADVGADHRLIAGAVDAVREVRQVAGVVGVVVAVPRF